MRRHIIAGFLLLFSGVGIWGAIDLTIEHFLVLTDPDHQAWCNIEGSNFDCSKVSRSRYSEHKVPLFKHPLPTSVPPLGFFGGFAVLVVLGWFRKGGANTTTVQARDETLAFAWLMLLPAAVVDLLLIYVMHSILHTWCIVCLMLDGATALLLIFTPLARKTGYRKLLRSGVMGGLRHFNWLIFGLVFVLLVVVGQRRYSHAIDGALRESREQFISWFGEQQPVPDLLSGDEQHRGVEGAPFTVVEFADFQCPYCAGCSSQIHEMAETYEGQIDFVFEHYPLGTDCNPGLSRDMHPDACMAAYAVECAAQHGKYWEMYDALWELFPAKAARGDRPSIEDIREVAHDLELPPTDFYYCLENEEIKQTVQESVLHGRSVGVSGTPAVFANGVLLPGGASSPVYLEWLIRSRLEKQGQELGDPITYQF